MSPIEIVVIILAVSYVCFIFGRRIYKLAKHKPLDTCEECHNRMKLAVKRMKKEQARKRKLEQKNLKKSCSTN